MGSALSSIDQDDYPVPDAATQENANYTLIPEVIGWQLCILAVGVALVLSAQYFSRAGRNDRPLVRGTVAVVTISMICSAAFSMAATTTHAADRDRSNNEISLIVTPDALNVIATAVSAIAVQTFLGIRAYRVLPRIVKVLFAIVTVPIALIGFAGGIGFASIALSTHGISDEDRGAPIGTAAHLEITANMWLFASAATDTLISVVLCARLAYLQRRIDGSAVTSEEDEVIGSTHSWLANLMRISLGAAGLTTVTAITAAILYQTTYATTNLTLTFANLLSPLYGLSLLYLLHSKHRLAGEVIERAEVQRSQIIWRVEGDHDRSSQLQAIVADGPTSHNVRMSNRRAPTKAEALLGHSVDLIVIEDLKSAIARDGEVFPPSSEEMLARLSAQPVSFLPV